MRPERLCLRPGSLALNLTGIITLGSLLVILPLTGCASSHAQQRVLAEQRWNQVRARVKYQLASQQFERGRIEAAVETVNEAIANDPSSPDQFLLLARCYLEQGKLVSARKVAELAQGFVGPGFVGPAFQPVSKDEPVGSAFSRSVMAEIDYILGVIAERNEQLEVALNHYRRARSLDESVMDYVVAEAECLTVVGRPEEAIVLVSANIGRFDSDGTLETLLAQICLLTGDKATALHSLDMAIERSGCEPGRSEAPGACATLIEEYGRLLSEAGRHAEAVALLRPYVQARRDAPPSVVTALCTAYLATGRALEAKALLREEVGRQGDNAKYWTLFAQASMMAGDWMTARRCADQLERLVPHSAQTHLLRGFVCWKQNDLQVAADSLRRALSIDPDDALTHCLIGRVLEDTGRPRAAVEEHYKRALQIDPKCAWAERLLGSPETDPAFQPTETGDARHPFCAASQHGEMLP